MNYHQRKKKQIMWFWNNSYMDRMKRVLWIGCIGVWYSSGKIRVSDLNTNNQEMPFYFWFHVKYFNNRINSKGFSTTIIPHKKKIKWDLFFNINLHRENRNSNQMAKWFPLLANFEQRLYLMKGLKVGVRSLEYWTTKSAKEMDVLPLEYVFQF